MCNQHLLTIIVNKSIKDDAVDVVLNLENITGFTMYNAYGYSRKHAQYDTKERVEGYKDFYRMDIAHDPKYFDDILKAFGSLGSRFNLKYWVVPLVVCGEIESTD